MAMHGSGNFRGCSCAHFGWDRVNFLQSSYRGAAFCICAAIRVEIQGCFHYCWAGLTQSQGLCCSLPTMGRAGGAAESGRGHGWAQVWVISQLFHSAWCSGCAVRGAGAGGIMDWWPKTATNAGWGPAELSAAQGKQRRKSLLCLVVGTALALPVSWLRQFQRQTPCNEFLPLQFELSPFHHQGQMKDKHRKGKKIRVH